MAPRGRRGRGRGRGAKVSPEIQTATAGSDTVNDDSSSGDSKVTSEEITINGSVEHTNEKLQISTTESRLPVTKKGILEEQDVNSASDSSAIITEDSDQEGLEKPAIAKESGTAETDSEIKFTLDDSEFAELETEDVEDPAQEGRTEDAVASPEKKEEAGVEAAAEKKVVTPPATNRKIKRKFGLEYIVVSIGEAAAGTAPPSMRDSPHECVLCLPRQAFNATILAKHVHSQQHLANVMKLLCPDIHAEYKDEEEASVLHAQLCKSVPDSAGPVKLLVVTENKLEDTRGKISAVIEMQQKKAATMPNSSKSDLRSKLVTMREKRALQTEDKNTTLEPAAKKNKVGDSPAAATASSSKEKTAPAEAAGGSGAKSVLIVGDERVQDLCSVCPELAESSDIICHPGHRLEKVLSSALVKMSSSYKVLVVISLLNDFVNEKTDSSAHLYMVNPNVDDLCMSTSKFLLKVKSLNPSMKVIFTIPHYIDFVHYSKRIRLLHQSDFARLEDFTCQVMRAFKQLHDNLRFMSKNMFCFNMNITLRDPTKNVESIRGRIPNSVTLMQFFPGTLLDGYHLSRLANERVSKDINTRVQKFVAHISRFSSSPKSNTMIECWADCDNIIIVGDHHTFKFETAAPSDMIKNVRLVTEKFAPIAVLLDRTDQLLNPSVDVVILVGLYREFAENVVNGRYTILEPKVPIKSELFGLLQRYCRKWQAKYPRLTVVFTIPQVVDFLKYNVANNKDIYKSEQFCEEMERYSHQFSINIMSFYKELRPALTMGSTSIWLYHMTNSLYEGNENLLPSLGNFSVEPAFPPNSTFDGFKPNQATAFRMRADLIVYITKRFRKHPVRKYKV